MKLFNAAIFTLCAAIALAIFAPSFSLDVQNDIASHETEETASSLRGMNRFLAQRNLMAYNMTCDKFPRVCRLKNSPGPDCCKKKCVNVKSDHLNCGMCGYKCKYTEICCKGKCVNTSFDKRNCGGCNKKCKKGAYCVYGMCNYA
ncbi:putative stigma-specific protein Stig1 [Lupinus albus]|uniref:Putative stigma-specific protein Stig1 n=1 Tax=Lupinus albus TaxID=3870 RepID=A0A6A4PL54_LUPAL|nr:putative stigma-specific protein Stig1 [Lupinus albus]